MKDNLGVIVIIAAVFLLIDFYVFSGIRSLTGSLQINHRKIIHIAYWAFTVYAMIVLYMLYLGAYVNWSVAMRTLIFGILMVSILTKLVFAVMLVLNDVQSLLRWLFGAASNSIQHKPLTEGLAISRSDFLLKAGLAVSAVPLAGMTYGILVGAHDYTVRKVSLSFKNLPKAWDGLKIVQISDIHAGSFYNKTAVQRGIDLILKQKPDIVFFTGDLVNNTADEMNDYIEVFSRIKAPLGVYSTLGNHDYGDYVAWGSAAEKHANLNRLIQIHKTMGWDILMNEHRILNRGGEAIAILGIENWGAKGRFPKYGKMNEAYKGTEQVPFKLLLSHDPSHWDAQVRTEYKDVDVMFAGHTHGMQFGIEKGPLKWSPVQWMYDQWAGLYKNGSQYLYVNRGFGYIGFPGRVGMSPEITVIELHAG